MEDQMKNKAYENKIIYLEEELEKCKMNTGIQLSNQKLEYENQIAEITKNCISKIGELEKKQLEKKYILESRLSE